MDNRQWEPNPANKRPSLWWLLIPLAAIVLSFPLAGVLLAHAGGSKAPTAPASPLSTPAPLNQTLRMHYWDMTVTGVERPGKRLVWSSAGNQSQAMGTWIVVPVVLTNHANGSLVVDRSDFALQDDAGIVYAPTTDTGVAFSYSVFRGGKTLAHTAVPLGTSALFYVAFDVPSEAVGLRIDFKQDGQPVVSLGS